jgi:hypothetical protein
MIHVAGGDNEHRSCSLLYGIREPVAQGFQRCITDRSDGNGQHAELPDAALKKGHLDLEGVLVLVGVGIFNEQAAGLADGFAQGSV